MKMRKIPYSRVQGLSPYSRNLSRTREAAPLGRDLACAGCSVGTRGRGCTMDESRFDHLTRSLTDRLSRRTVSRWGAATAALGLATFQGAHEDAKGKKKKKKKKCKPNCANRNCGADGCGGTCGSCTSTQVCSNSGQCLCAPNQISCPAGSASSCCDPLLGCCPNGTGQNGCCPSGSECCAVTDFRPRGGCCGNGNHCASNKSACCPGNFPVSCAGTDSCCHTGDSCCPADKGSGCCPAAAPVCCADALHGEWCCPTGSICDEATGGCESTPARGRHSAQSAGPVGPVGRSSSANDVPHS